MEMLVLLTKCKVFSNCRNKVSILACKMSDYVKLYLIYKLHVIVVGDDYVDDDNDVFNS